MKKTSETKKQMYGNGQTKHNKIYTNKWEGPNVDKHNEKMMQKIMITRPQAAETAAAMMVAVSAANEQTTPD